MALTENIKFKMNAVIKSEKNSIVFLCGFIRFKNAWIINIVTEALIAWKSISITMLFSKKDKNIDIVVIIIKKKQCKTLL